MKNGLNALNWILENQVELERRDRKLEERAKKLFALLPEQNERLSKLYRGYKKLGLINDSQSNILEPITLDKFRIEIENLSKRFESINGNPKTKEEMYESREKIEHYISDMMDLIQSRWYTICSFIDLWRKERFEVRKDELKLENEYYI